MKHIYLATLAFFVLWSASPAQSQEITLFELNESLVEFCAATFLVTSDTREYALWVKKFSLDHSLVDVHRTIIETALEQGVINTLDVLEAANNCSEARTEAEEPGD